MAGTFQQPIDETTEVVEAVVVRALSLLTEGLAGGSSRDLTARLRSFGRMARMVEGHLVAVVAEAERTDSFLDDGHVSSRNWVAAETNSTTAEGLARSRTARLTLTCPVVGEQLCAGTLGIPQARELGRVRANPRVGEQVDDIIEPLLDEAHTAPVHGFVAMVRQWEALVDADGSHRNHDAAHRGRRLRMWRGDDQPGGELWGRFGADDFAEICDILDHYNDAEFATDVDAARAEHGPDTCDADLARSRDQRRADALLQALRDAAASHAPSADVEPTVNYVIAGDLFDEQVRAFVEDRPASFDSTSLRNRLCTTTNGVPVDPAAVVAAALVGHIRRIVINAEGRVIDVGRRRRCFTRAAKEAIVIQGLLDASDGRCLWPGCGRRRNNQADHVHEWQHDGPSDLANAGPFCGRHNRTKSHGYTVCRDPTGHWHLHRPDGTELAPSA